MLLQSELPRGGLVAELLPGAGCSPVLHCLHNSHMYSSEQYSVHLLRISFSSVRHFPDLSWIVEDLPSFSEVRSFTSWYALLLLFFVHASFNLFALSTYPVLLCFLHCLLNPPVCFPVFFCSFCFIPLLLQISPLITEVENIFGDPKAFSCDVPSQVSHWLRQSLLYCKWQSWYRCPWPRHSVQWVVRTSHL